jgi:small subunit ribosomal protein S6
LSKLTCPTTKSTYSAIVASFKGTILKVEKWGKRKLAYEIRKLTTGYYVMIDYAGKSAVIGELERNFKIDDKVLKFMTIMKDDNVDLAKIEKDKQAETQEEVPRKALIVESPISPVESPVRPAESMEIETVKDSTSSESIQS